MYIIAPYMETGELHAQINKDMYRSVSEKSFPRKPGENLFT